MRSATLFTTLALLSSASILWAAEVPRLPQNIGGMSKQSGAPAVPAKPPAAPTPAKPPPIAPPADELRLTGLSPPSGNLTGLAHGSTYAPGNHVEASFEYALRTAARGVNGTIRVFTSGVPGNPDHTGVAGAATVVQGTGRARVPFSVLCDRATPTIAITNLRIVLQEHGAGGGLVRTLVERQQPVSFQFQCSPATATAPAGVPSGFINPGATSSVPGITHKPQGPKLALILTQPMTDVITVRNQGDARAAASRLNLTCRRERFGADGPGCPTSVFPQRSTVYPDVWAVGPIDIPSLAPGANHSVRLPSWPDHWSAGRYHFGAIVFSSDPETRNATADSVLDVR